MPTLITVSDANTKAPIVGARVFINGVGMGVTDSKGHFTVTPISTTYKLSITSAGYQNYLSISESSTLAAVGVLLQPTVTVSTGSFTLNIIPEGPAIGALFTFSNSGSPVTTNYNQGGIKVPALTIGLQTITANIPGYQPISDTFDMSATPSGVIQLMVITDQGNQQASQTLATSDPDVTTMLPALTPQDLPEFIASNTGQGTYFTMTQARVYIGNLFIDELNALQFALQDNKIPIYGYASRYFDAMAQGKSLVQGQFTINFISEGYLYLALQNYENQILQGDLATDPVTAQQQARMQTLVNQLQNPDPAWTPTMIANAKAEINNLAASLGPNALTNAKAGISTDTKFQLNNTLGLAGGDYPNAVYSDIPFDIVIQYTGAGRTITRRLEKCFLISNESIMDHSGTPILDSYGFVARRLR